MKSKISRRPFSGRTLALVGSSVATVGLGFLSLDLFLQYQRHDEHTRIAAAAVREGRAFDRRTVASVVDDLALEGVRAQPFFRLIYRATDLMPLGNTPDTTIVYCNEIGSFLIFDSDRHGFNNPEAVWDESEIDVALIGDSFVQGACVPDRGGFADLLRSGGETVLNLGVGGNNPQLNLATLIEYALPLRPRNIVWFHYAGNDLADMADFRGHRFLDRYVEEEFSQSLLEKSVEVKKVMNGVGKERLAEVFAQAQPQSPWRALDVARALRLGELRNRLGLVWVAEPDLDFAYFSRIVGKAIALSRVAGSRLAFVILPDIDQMPHGDHRNAEVARTAEVLRAQGATVFDLTSIFRDAGPEAVFAQGNYGGHLSSYGNEVVAAFLHERVLPALRDGASPGQGQGARP